MKIDELFKIQSESNSKLILDDNIHGYKLLARKHLELQVKMSDLAKETNCYKYWVDGDTSYDKDKILIKYIACFKQVLSLGLDKNYDNIDNVVIQPSEYCLSDQFLNLYVDINDLLMSSSEDHYMTLLEDFLSLSISLGFSEKEIYNCFN